ncbi:MAG: hypothetical protein GY874_09000 [Desulfobacteraceae bacterium]|nr:hypothetical protein [Desulfobacteraceae bacterium]
MIRFLNRLLGLQSRYEIYTLAQLNKSIVFIISLLIIILATIYAGTVQAGARGVSLTRIDARPAGHTLDSGGIDPVIDSPLLRSQGILGQNGTANINGPSLIRIPDWIPASERIHPDAKYYLYFASHGGSFIRMAWAGSLTGAWEIFNWKKNGPDSAWGENGNNTGATTPGNGVLDLDLGDSEGIIWIDDNFGVENHIASPNVYVDDVNQRIVMYFHGTHKEEIGVPGAGAYVATSKYGLNFNMPNDGGEPGHGIRNMQVANQYMVPFTIPGQAQGQQVNQMFCFANEGYFHQAPTFTNAGEPAAIANGDDLGGLWNTPTGAWDPVADVNTSYWKSIDDSANPLNGIARAPETIPPGEATTNWIGRPRHFSYYYKPGVDKDTFYIFYTARKDMPESILVVTLDFSGLSETQRLDPTQWKASGEQFLMRPELDWEGVNHPLKPSQNGSASHAHQLRDPCVFEDADGSLYLLYAGEGEGAIGLSRLTISKRTRKDKKPDPQQAKAAKIKPHKPASQATKIKTKKPAQPIAKITPQSPAAP